MAKLNDVIKRGTLAARPAAGVAGRLYFVTDNSTMYFDSGTAWESVEGAGGMTNPMTTAGDMIYGGASGAATRLGIGTAGQVLTVNAGASAPEWAAAGGGGGVGWLQGISEAGTAFTNFTANSGTWASDGTVITQSLTGASHHRARHNTKLAIGLPFILETELRLDTEPSTDSAAGFLVGYDGAAATGGSSVGLITNGDKIQVERHAVSATRVIATPAAVAVATWYKLRLVYNGSWVSIYLGGTLVGTAFNDAIQVNADYIGLYTYNATASFRNVKGWTLATGLPA